LPLNDSTDNFSQYVTNSVPIWKTICNILTNDNFAVENWDTNLRGKQWHDLRIKW